MRFWYGLLFWISVTSFTFAQSRPPKNQLGVSLIQMSFGSLDNQFSNNAPLLEKGIALAYKRKLYDFFYLRANYSYYYSNTDGNYYNTYYSYNKHYSSLGAEVRYYHSENKKLQLYSGVDLTGFVIKTQFSNMFFTNDFGKVKGLGVQPFMGIEINPLRNWFITYEGSILAALSHRKNNFDNRIFIAPQNSTHISTITSPYYQFTPLRFLSVGVRF